MNNANVIFEVEILNKLAYLKNDNISKAMKLIAENGQYHLFKDNEDFKAYIAKIVTYSLFYENGIDNDTINTDPKEWVVEPSSVQGASNFYSIQYDKEKEIKQLIIATGIKDSDNSPLYLLFSENRNPDKQPWYFNRIINYVGYIKNKPKCITDSINTNVLKELNDIKENIIDFTHILSEKDETKGLLRLPEKFQVLSERESKCALNGIIHLSIIKQKQNIKSTIRYDKTKERIVFNHYLPLDFSAYDGNKYELYACIREIKGPNTTAIEIPTILTYEQVYSQLLEKPKIDHWTYALCKFGKK